MNTNCVAGYIGGTGRNQLASVLTAANTETSIKVGADSGTNAIAVLTVPQPSAKIGSSNPLSTEANPALLTMGGRLGLRYQYAGRPGFTTASFDKGRPFLVRLAGTIKSAASAADIAIVFNLYSGTFGGTCTAIGTTVANALNTVTNTYAFILEAQLVYNSAYATNNLNGQFWYWVGGSTASYNTWAATTTASVATLATNLFTATYAWAGAGATGGTVSPSEFSISQM
jgi:hypothetical protein